LRPFDLHNVGKSNVYEIEFENGEKIICTDTHKWYIKDSNGNLVLIKLKDIIKNNITEILNFTTI
jgi:intein/homing endonuclease